MKGEWTLAILEALAEKAFDLSVGLEVFLAARHGTSMKGLLSAYEKRIARGSGPERRERQKYYALIYNLKKDGLIRGERNGGILSLTVKGSNKLGLLKKRSQRRMPSPKYKNGSGKKEFTIVTFDIPEKERWKREWLRSVLRNSGLRKIQQSVWLGQTALPEEFLNDLRRLKLMDSVEIFQISRMGSLRHIA